MANIFIPDFLKHLPVEDRGYPVPFFVPYVNGKPFFRGINSETGIICFEKKLCGVCGKKLDKKEYCFVGGPLAMKNKISTDAHMHYRCAKYALQVCPYLFHQNTKRTFKEGAHEDIIISDKPEVLYILVADKCEWFEDNKHRLFRFRTKRAHEYKYVDHKLTETGNVFRYNLFGRIIV